MFFVDGFDIINSSAVETLARELYGLRMAFDLCKRKEDWQKPKGANKDWASKIRWELRDRFSVRKLLVGGHRVRKAENEVKKSMEVTREEQKQLRSQRQPIKVFERPFENLNSKGKRPTLVAGDRSPNTGTVARLKNKSQIDAVSGPDFDTQSAPAKALQSVMVKKQQ